MNIDMVNGLFEVTGGIFAWRNAAQLYKDCDIVGVYWPTYGFLCLWGLWSLLFYSALAQPYSFYGGACILSGNLAWLIQALLIVYGTKGNSK